MSITRQSATKILSDIHSGELSAAELMQATLAQIENLNGSVNAIVAMRDPDELMAQARAADDSPTKGALHGLPFAVKDTGNAAGLPTTLGSPILAGNIAAKDDIAIGRIRAAGAIIIGKTNVPEFGLGSHTFNPVYGTTHNPYDTSKSCGGSSGGASVALATGMVALADGSDIMGSLRNPAAWNNIYGMRPSWAAVPAEPKGDTFLSQLAAAGPMARSPEDISLLLNVMAGPDPRQPHNTVIPSANTVRRDDLTGVRVGWLGNWGGAYPMEEGLMSQCETSLSVMSDLGAEIVSLPPPFAAEEIWDSWITLRSWETAIRLLPLAEHRSQLKDSAIWELERGMAMSAMEVHRASVIRSDWFRRAAELFEQYDVLMMPTTQNWPFDVDMAYPTEIAGHAMDTYHQWMDIVVPVSLIGVPALAMPAGFGANGLPAGVQIFGPRGSDAKILEIGAAYHAATEWPQKYPAKVGAT
jgi:amidase